MDTTNKWILFAWFVLIYLAPLVIYRPGYMNLVVFFMIDTVLSGSMFLFMINHYHIMGVYDFLYVPFIMTAYACQRKPFIWIGMVASFFIFLAGTWLGGQFNEQLPAVFINTSLFYVIGFCLGRITSANHDMKRLAASIQEKNKALDQYSRKIEELTIMEERNRVSQDLHDTVGHIFTSVITSLDALPFLMNASMEEAENTIKEVCDLARKGLDDVRQTIHQITPSEPQQPLSHSFHQIIDEFIKHTGTNVVFQMEGTERELEKGMKNTLIRCLQEGLTNAKRHGQATQIVVKTCYDKEFFMLQIKDNGVGTDSVQPGFGLQTMKDRLISVNGSLTIRSKVNEGMEIHCLIPLGKEVANK
ncbi:sensor histidine kinase [Neobacillus muris]|uniref:sensor histidine kinase n=1 Tax=Neobacillus muris TaxID=2941334 RepID=UPI00203C8F4E|nr:sensor histidine kinase [Neobacillus muris]